jgi:hypothetical protein
MQTLRVDLILFVVMGAAFLFALRGGKLGWTKGSLTGSYRMEPLSGFGSFRMEPFVTFLNLFWACDDHTPKEWPSAPYKRGYASSDYSNRRFPPPKSVEVTPNCFVLHHP